MLTPQRPRFNKIKNEKYAKGRAEFQLVYNNEQFKQGACSGTDTEFFFPPQDVFSREDKAFYTRICNACPILDMCREWAIVHERYGVWGGMIPIERERERKRLGWALIDPTLGLPRAYKAH